ncbi:MAG: hypothetical protein ACI9W6_002139 [Motiliproteus sp.]|jgi:hypothetical protein
MRTPADPDRRLSFRINDHAWVELVPLPERPAKGAVNTCFDASPQFRLLTDLQQLDTELQHQLFKLTDTNTVLASALQLLNRKIDRLALQASTADSAQTLQPITLSEAGVSLYVQQPLVAASLCAVRIRLLPSGYALQNYALQSYARVSYCLPQDAAGHRAGLEFIELDETGRDLIARHLLEHQAHNRRRQRGQSEDNPSI